MKTLCQNFLFTRSSVGIGLLQSSTVGLGCKRALSITNFLRAAKPPKPLPKKTPKKILDYKSPTPKPKPAQTPKPQPNHSFRGRRTPLILGGGVLFLLSTSLTYLIISINRTNSTPAPITPSTQADVSSRYNTIASSFDGTIDSGEYWLGLKSLRKKLASLAHGDVLEVSIGTGRNLEYYDWNFKGLNGVGRPDRRGNMKWGKVKSFTAVDKSAQMVEVAEEKFEKLFPGVKGGVRWVVADAAEKGAIPSSPGSLQGKYDTIVQTMGLCSVADPVGLLRNLGECVKEDEGRILLLEHGRGRWKWLNKTLDQSAEAHANNFGCWWNRDMKAIVEESGLEVVKIQTPKWWHGGTTWWIELKKPKSKITERSVERTPALKEAPTPITEPKKKWL